MFEGREKYAHLPYGNLVIKILKEIRYEFGNEEFKEETAIIGSYVLPSIK